MKNHLRLDRTGRERKDLDPPDINLLSIASTTQGSAARSCSTGDLSRKVERAWVRRKIDVFATPSRSGISMTTSPTAALRPTQAKKLDRSSSEPPRAQLWDEVEGSLKSSGSRSPAPAAAPASPAISLDPR